MDHIPDLVIIEHPTKGTISAVPGDVDEKYHWNWSRMRDDEVGALRFSLRTARLHMPNLPKEAYILEFLTWERVDDAPGD